MNAYYFREDKTAVLGAMKAQLPFSESKYQLLNSLNKFPFLTANGNGKRQTSDSRYPSAVIYVTFFC